MRTTSLGAFGLGLLVTFGCGSPTDEETNNTPGAAVVSISHTQAALNITGNLEAGLRGLLNAGGFLAESSAVLDAANTMGGAGETCSLTTADCVGDAPCTTAPTTETCTTEELTFADMDEARTELHDALTEMIAELNERFFSAENVESETDKVVTYLLGPEDLCGESGDVVVNPDGTVTETSSLDPECVADMTRLQPRLRVTSPAEGDVDVILQLTEQRFEPLVFELHRTRLAVTADLEQLALAIEAFGEDIEGLETLSGQTQIELVKNAELDYSLRSHVLEDLVLIASNEGEMLEVSFSASSPASEFRVDGNAKTISSDYNYGALRIVGPLSMFADSLGASSGDSTGALSGVQAPPAEGDLAPVTPTPVEPEEPTYTGTIEFLLAGLSGGFLFNGDVDVFQFTNLGLGDQSSTIKHNGNTLLALDVNKAQGRRFDVTVQDTTSGLAFSLSPTLDVELLLNFAHVADQFDVADSLLNDTLRLWFDGDNPTVVANDAGLEVTSGTLHLTSSAAPEYNLDVAAGMCLTGLEEVAPSTTSSSADDSAELPAADPLSPELVPAEPAPVEPVPVEEDEHPFSQLEVNTCE